MSALLPLSHHEILALSEPMARAGWRLDAAASRREARHLCFVRGAAPEGGAPGDDFGPTLDVDASRPRRWRLTRTLVHPQAGRATLRVSGPDLAPLVAALEAVPAERHFPPGHPGLARHYEIEVPAGGAATPPLLVEGTVTQDGLRAVLSVPDARGVAAELALRPTGPRRASLPEDFVAVLGWDWARLVPEGSGWSSRLRLRGNLPARTRRAEQALERLAAHLAATLADTPEAYHARLRRARWGVFFRRGIPTFTAIALAVSAVTLKALQIDLTMAQWIALYHLPTLIIAVSFALQELPRFEIPPWPRPLRDRAWFSG